MRLTSAAKKGIPSAPEDLYNRGKRLILESVEAGVTAMRAFVEVDETVKMTCLDVGLRLKNDFGHILFAQEPLFLPGVDSDSGATGDNYHLLCEGIRRPGVETIASAPYVEANITQAKANISLVLDLAWDHDLHVDFHLDYNIDPDMEPLIWNGPDIDDRGGERDTNYFGWTTAERYVHDGENHATTASDHPQYSQTR
ncbi:hypothetical protein NLI96_g5766 [Meripilus lineatus]|uniref:Uncharacterized protein n=1 Tax=Meripilus lineatus TaxID=2056292 RepID=A0AAD5YIQ6_9APHY|nr:hypothetical protein NLI96_g5766 [Physisporinus lineatus]